MLKVEKEEIVKLGNSKEAVGKYTEAIKYKIHIPVVIINLICCRRKENLALYVAQ